MMPGDVRLLPLFVFLSSALGASAASPFAIDIDLTQQKAFLFQDGKVVYESPISSGRPNHRTPTGNFIIDEKDENHTSSLYGKIVDANGKTLTWDADSDMAKPPGAKFVQAPMKHFLRFDGATGMHAGQLPGYPASHGCVRMPPVRAALFFDIVELGTPVRVYGTPPNTTPPERPRKAAATPTPTPAPRKWYQIIHRVTPAPTPVATPSPTPPR
jgi:lipoprotein-anchoring transpeptidase ErfK/SrfK